MAPLSILCLIGQTGVGKTAASLHLARAFNGCVINCDSRQVYRDFPVITARPTPQEQSVCPHKLFGFLSMEEQLTAGVFADAARKEINDCAGAGMLPILTGGTGLYLRALIQGLAPIPNIAQHVRDKVQHDLDNLGPNALHARLCDIDPAYAEKIHPNDKQRIGRALEVHAATGKTLTEWHARDHAAPEFRALKIGIFTEAGTLYPRLEERIDLMLQQGAVEEARAAYQRCPDPEAPGWSGIGCAELLEYIRGNCTLEEARELWLKNTKAYAKRQATWFRKEPDVLHFEASDTAGIEDAVRNFLHNESTQETEQAV